jgi:hypothetical protein
MGNSLSELEQPPPQTHQQHSQSQPQQHQPNEPTNKEELRLPSRRENNLLLSPQHNSESSRKTGQNGTVVTQSAAKPLIKQQSFPHNYDHILKDADSTVDKSSREKLCDQLYAGVFLHHKTKASSIYSLSKTTTSL